MNALLGVGVGGVDWSKLSIRGLVEDFLIDERNTPAASIPADIAKTKINTHVRFMTRLYRDYLYQRLSQLGKRG